METTINQRIEKIRVSLKYPVQAFGRKIGASQSAIMNVLSKGDDPSIRMIHSILAIFPVQKEWIFLGTGPMWTVKEKDLAEHFYKVSEGPDIDAGIVARVKQIRTELGLSQAIFASEIGMTRDSLAFMETSRSMPQVPALKKLIKKFNVSCQWLLFGEGPRLAKGK